MDSTTLDLLKSIDRNLAGLLQVARLQMEALNRLEQLHRLKMVKEKYTVEEVALKTGKTAWTIRQACNKGRIKVDKLHLGGGAKGEWRIPHEELVRIQNEGF